MNLRRKGRVIGGLTAAILAIGIGLVPTLTDASGLTPVASASAHTGTIDCTSATLNTLSGWLKPGDHINVDISVNGGPTQQVNAYVDQNIAGGFSYGSYNNLGLRIKILGVEQTPIPLTGTQVKSESFTFTYSSYLTGSWQIQWGQFNDYHWNHQHLEVNYFNCSAPRPATGDVVFQATHCTSSSPIGNSAVVTLAGGTTAEGFIQQPDNSWTSYGNVAAGNYDDGTLGTDGYPNTRKIVLTGEDGSMLTFGPFTFPEPKVAADCQTLTPHVTIQADACYYDADQNLSFKPVYLIYDNTGSNTPVEFKVAAPFDSLSLTVPAGETRTVRAQDGWQDGVGYQVTASGQVFNVSVPAFVHCKPEVTPVTPRYADATCEDPNSGRTIVPIQPVGVTWSLDSASGIVTFAPDEDHVFPAGFNPIWKPVIIGPGTCLTTLAHTGVDVGWLPMVALAIIVIAIGLVLTAYYRSRRENTASNM